MEYINIIKSSLDILYKHLGCCLSYEEHIAFNNIRSQYLTTNIEILNKTKYWEWIIGACKFAVHEQKYNELIKSHYSDEEIKIFIKFIILANYDNISQAFKIIEKYTCPLSIDVTDIILLSQMNTEYLADKKFDFNPLIELCDMVQKYTNYEETIIICNLSDLIDLIDIII